MLNLAKVLLRHRLTGVLTHHADFTGKKLQIELKRFFECMARLRTQEHWQIMLFSDFLKVSKND